ncbi:ribose-phosphate diphosphokinase [Caenimonas terrae]|uniref:Ribose-phosphate diphosphokinase n=1 Tax=Caenimonas terrae TaxID=696074 RepID=A0ABW0NJH5_9BURK
MNDTAACLFALDASRAWGEAVAARMGLALMPHEEREFEDGEHKARPLASVRGRDVYVLQSLYGDGDQSVNDKLCRLLFFIGALKDAAAASVTAVVPCLAYARKDRKSKPRDPITTRYVAALFEAVGTDRVLTLDVHNLAAYQNAFRCGTEHLEASGLFAAHFLPLLGRQEVAVVSPDAGGIKRAEAFRLRLAAALGRPVAAAFAEKHRSEGVVSGEMIVGDVAGRCAIVIDDLIGAGTTILRTALACRRLGATAVYGAASHGLFVGSAPQLLAADALTGLVVTDSVPPFRLPPGKVRDKLVVLSTAPLFAEAIARIHGGGSITALLEEA